MGGEGAEQAAELIRRVASGDREAFARLYDLLAPLVFAFALRMLKARAEAEDLLQDAWCPWTVSRRARTRTRA